MTKFQNGDRVKLSTNYTKNNKTSREHSERVGTIGKYSIVTPECVSVLWDGRSTKTTYHESFLEKVTGESS